MRTIPYLLLGILFTLLHSNALALQNKVVIGRVENVRIYPGNLILHAKVDTGSKNSSLGCDTIQTFEQNGEKWVRFSVTTKKGKTITIERKVHRMAKIKRHFGKITKRIVINLGVCLGNVYKETEVNLTNRSGFNYYMLIGRSFMEDDFIVDPSLKYTTKPTCKEAAN
ncbi:MAG: ATP-dependent zinc protease [Pseudomonadota bacterium]